jgi:hypothetical protein
MTPRSRGERRPWHQHFETVGSITAIVVGVAALYVSFDQSRVMREELRASIWPALQVDGFVSREDDLMLIGLAVHNAGVGPALVRRVTIRHEGEPVPDLETLRSLMSPGADLSFQTLSGRILAADAMVRPFELRVPDSAAADASETLARLQRDWSAEVCYCSTLNQCWIANVSGQPPREVDRCDDQASGSF